MLPCNKCSEFCKNTLHKSYNFTSYSNITAEKTLHKIIITHITFIFIKRSFFKQFKHMMHTIDTQLLYRHLECHTRLYTSHVQRHWPTCIHTQGWRTHVLHGWHPRATKEQRLWQLCNNNIMFSNRIIIEPSRKSNDKMNNHN